MTESQARALQQTATGNSGTVLQIGTYYGQYDVVPVHPVPVDERNIIMNAFAPTRTADQAFDLLKYHGVAIIVGKPGTGRHASALRALLGSTGRTLYLLSADWDDNENLREERLVTCENSGLLLELGSRRISAETVNSLIGYGDRLKEVGSALVITVDESAWPDTSLAQAQLVPAFPPSPVEVVANHLEHRGLRDRVDWVKPSHKTGLFGSGKQEDSEPVLGKLASDLTPDDAVRLASLIAKSRSREEAENGVPQEFKRWEADLEEWWDRQLETDEKIRNRALILTVALLEGATVEELHSAWRSYLQCAGETAEKSTLAGSGFRPRLNAIHATIRNEKVSFASRPEYGSAVLERVWRDWPNARITIRKWIQEVTAKDGVGGPYVGNIGHLLVSLSERVDGVPLTEIIRGWFRDYYRESADVLTRAALNESTGPEIRAKLRSWAQQTENDSPKVVARVCASEFARRYPHQALIRLKWVLDRPKADAAGQEARVAIEKIAAGGYSERLRILEALVSWADKDTEALAGPRGFLALISNSEIEPVTLRNLIEDASRDPKVMDQVTRLWVTALTKPELADEAYEALTSAIHP